MKKFEGVLIAADFDGTFADSTGNVPQSNIDSIKYFIDNGGRFTVCTGRTYQGFHKFDSTYINAPVILCNGTMAYDYEKGEIVFHHGLGENVKKIAAEVSEKYPDTPIEMYPFNETYVIHPNHTTEPHLMTMQSIHYSVVDSAEDLPLPFMKMMFSSTHERLTEIAALTENYDDISFIDGFNKWLELVRPDVNKGSGLLSLADALGLKHENVCAVGDGYNDVDMLKAVEKSFTPTNGCDAAKNAAKYTVCSNDEGCIADVIRILDGLY